MQLYDIYWQYQRDLLRFATSLTQSKEPAEDLVQQAYLKALSHLQLFEQMHPEQIKGWFFTTIKRLFLDTYRRQRKFVGEFCEEIENREFCQSFEGQLIDKIAVQEALSMLSEDQRQLIVLRYISGRNAQEIAHILGRNPSTIRSALSVARAHFIKHLNLEEAHEKL